MVRRAGEELAQATGRSPTIDEIATHLRVDREDVLRGLSATAAYNVGTLDGGGSDDESEIASDRQRALASEETGYVASENSDLVAQLLEQLPEREREIVRLRFFDRRSQSEIAEIVGISQMHVSRLLRRSFEQMRDVLESAPGEIGDLSAVLDD